MKYRDPSTGNFKPIKFKVSDTVPVGAIMEWTTETAPDGWLICDGSAISRTEYSQLFDVIGTTYGEGDGSTTFNIPEIEDTTSIIKAYQLIAMALKDTCNQITATCDDFSITTTQESEYTNIPIDTVVASVGNKLTLDTTNKEIVIGSDVSYVSVSASCAIAQASAGMTYQALLILKNGNQYSKWANSRGSYSSSVTTYNTLADILIPVQAGDKIKIALYNRLAGTVNVQSALLSVKMVK